MKKFVINKGYIMNNKEFITGNTEIYFSKKLKNRFNQIYSDIIEILNEHDINYNFVDVPSVWIGDYMPVQTYFDKFVKFKTSNKKYDETCLRICNKLDINVSLSDIILDGGNLVLDQIYAVITDKIFDDNKNLSKKEVIYQIEKILENYSVIFIPGLNKDQLKHSTTMLRFIDKKTVIVNNYSNYKEYREKLFNVLKREKLDIYEFPIIQDFLKKNKEGLQDYNEYLCYTHLNNDSLLYPTYNDEEDKIAINHMKQFYDHIETVNANILANCGGGLDCILWERTVK